MPGMNLKQAAEYLGLPVTTLAAHARAGRIPGAKVGKHWVFAPKRLDAWLTRQIDSQTAQRRRQEAPAKPPSKRGRPRNPIPDLPS